MGFIPVASLHDVPPGRSKEVMVGAERILVCNVNGTVYAVGDVCTHDNGPLGQGTLEGNEIECPRHGARFDVKTGKVLCLPAILPIPTFEVKVEGAQIFVADTATVQR